MSILLMVNVGNSDLLADGGRPRRPRTDGELLWNSYEQHHFEFPIILPCLQELLKEHQHINTLLLFYTDQPENESTLTQDRFGVSLREKDTRWFANIIERYLREHFASQIGTIIREKVQRGDGTDINPSIYDETFDAYEQLVTRHFNRSTDICYVLMAGGIPACNTALQLQAVSCYGERCHTVYQPERGTPYELRIGEQVLSTFRRATAIDALERQDFGTALSLAEQVATVPIINLISYAHYRESFDFERAQMALKNAQKYASGEIRHFLDTLRHDLDEVMTRKNMGALLQELVANAFITYRNGRYADFLGRIFRFQEAALRYIVEVKLDLPTDMSKEMRDKNTLAFREGIAANSALQNYMQSRTVDGQPLHYDTPNIPVLQALLDYLVQPGVRADGTYYLTKAEQGRYGEIKRRLNKLNTLSQLRNQSVIAHGFAGVSAEQLEKEYSGDPKDIVSDIHKITQLLGFTVNKPFERIANFAVEQLRLGR